MDNNTKPQPFPLEMLFQGAYHNACLLLENRLLGWTHRKPRDIRTKVNTAQVVERSCAKISVKDCADLKCENPGIGSPDAALHMNKLSQFYGRLYITLGTEWKNVYREPYNQEAA